MDVSLDALLDSAPKTPVSLSAEPVNLQEKMKQLEAAAAAAFARLKNGFSSGYTLKDSAADRARLLALLDEIDRGLVEQGLQNTVESKASSIEEAVKETQVGRCVLSLGRPSVRTLTEAVVCRKRCA